MMFTITIITIYFQNFTTITGTPGTASCVIDSVQRYGKIVYSPSGRHGRFLSSEGGLSYEKGVFNDNGELAGDLWVWGRNRCICEHEHAKVG